MIAPQTNGAQMAYEKVFQPFLKAHKSEIEDFVNNVKDKAGAAADEAIKKSKEVATEATSADNMMKAAAAAQAAKEKYGDN